MLGKKNIAKIFFGSCKNKKIGQILFCRLQKKKKKCPPKNFRTRFARG